MMDNSKKLKFHFQRFEFKYIFPQTLIEGILPVLLKHMEFDPFASSSPDQAYTVSSLYFDSPGLGSYYEKIAGLSSRKKLRIRYYGERLGSDTPVFLEIKRKYNMVVIKDRLRLTQDECRDIIKNQKKIVLPYGHDRDTLEEFLWIFINNSMLPQVFVVYKRKPLISKIDPSFRITIDHNLFVRRAAWLDDLEEAKSVEANLAILEVKFNNLLPLWFQRIIHRFNLQPQPFSKYCSSLEHCHPQLERGGQWLLSEPALRAGFSTFDAN